MFPKKEIRAYNDSIIALYGGTFRHYGAVVCAGTGLNIAVCGKSGECFVFGDYLGRNLQGGSALAKRGARMVFDAHLGLGRAEGLRDLYLDYAGVEDVDQLLYQYKMNEEFQAQLRYIVPDILTLAWAGDSGAGKLLQSFAEEISTYLLAGLKRMDMLEDDADIVLTGGVLKGKENLLTQYLVQKIKEKAPKTNIFPAKYEPVAGACVMGMLRKGEFTQQMQRELSDSGKEMRVLREQL